MTSLQRFAYVVALAVLTACRGGGGGGDSNPTPHGPTPPAAPTLSLGFGVKELRFDWQAVTGADFYRLLEDPDGLSGYTQVGGDLTTLSVNHVIPVHRRLNASYVLQACNNIGCSASAAQILGSNLKQAIGYMKASNTEAHDQFGFSVALSADGDTLAVGARGESSGTTGIDSTPDETALEAGAVYVFTHSGGSWAQQAYVKASNTGAHDAFGASVALSTDGSTLAVGATGESSSVGGINSTPDDLALEAGAVYVFVRSAGSWAQQAYLKASAPGSEDHFGNAVALSSDGDTLAVGAMREDGGAAGINGVPDESVTNAGAVYVFSRSGAVWSQQAYIKASNPGIGDEFGVSVALSADGNTLAAGTIQEDSGTTGIDSVPDESAPESGAVYVFVRSGGVWSQQAYVKASNTGSGDSFGESVALSADGNMLAVGATGEDSGTTGTMSTPNETATNSGAVYVFTRSSGTWSQQAYLKASNTGAGDAFGNAVALSSDGNTLAVGAPSEASGTTGIGGLPDESAPFAGAVYVFVHDAGGWSQQAYVKAPNTGGGDLFGARLALSSDGNTLAVTSNLEGSSTTGINSTSDDLAPQAGAAYLY